MSHSRRLSRPAALLAALVYLAAGAALSGCNTVEGAGKDLEAAGNAIADAARSAKKELED